MDFSKIWRFFVHISKADIPYFDFDDTDSIFCLPIFIVRCFDGHFLEKSHLKEKCIVKFFEKSNILLLIFSLHAHCSSPNQIKPSTMGSYCCWSCISIHLHNQKIFPITLIFPIMSNVETKFRKKNQNLRIDVRFYRRLFDPNVSSQLTNKHSFVLHNELFD